MPFSIIRSPSQDSIVSDQNDDILDLVAGPGISITTNSAIDTIVISATTTVPGEQGYTGSRGFTGSAGNTGPQGSVGFTGSAGAIGGLGYSGSQGVQGFAGSVGTLGYAGSVGSQGPLGYSGSQGIEGYTGSFGIKGYTGSQGDTGSVGNQGATGFTGSFGVTGFTGSVGDTGFTGSQGDIGYSGSVGSQGLAGFTGSQGDMGYVGSQGVTGYTGSVPAVPTAIIVSLTGNETKVTAKPNIKNFRMPFAANLVAVRASLANAQTGGSIISVQITKNGANLLTSLLTIDNNETTSKTAVSQPVVDLGVATIADDDEIKFDVVTASGTGSEQGTGLQVTLEATLL